MAAVILQAAIAAAFLTIGFFVGWLYGFIMRDDRLSQEVFDLRSALVDLRHSVNSMRASMDKKTRKPRTKKAKR